MPPCSWYVGVQCPLCLLFYSNPKTSLVSLSWVWCVWLCNGLASDPGCPPSICPELPDIHSRPPAHHPGKTLQKTVIMAIIGSRLGVTLKWRRDSSKMALMKPKCVYFLTVLILLHTVMWFCWKCSALNGLWIVLLMFCFMTIIWLIITDHKCAYGEHWETGGRGRVHYVWAVIAYGVGVRNEMLARMRVSIVFGHRKCIII